MKRTLGIKLLPLLAITLAAVALSSAPAMATDAVPTLPSTDTAAISLDNSPQSLITPEGLLLNGTSFIFQSLGGVESQSCFGNCSCDGCNCSSGCSLEECSGGCAECFKKILPGGCDQD